MAEPKPTEPLKPRTLRFTNPMWEGMQETAELMGTNVNAWVTHLIRRELKELGRWDDSMAGDSNPKRRQRTYRRKGQQDR